MQLNSLMVFSFKTRAKKFEPVPAAHAIFYGLEKKAKGCRYYRG